MTTTTAHAAANDPAQPWMDAVRALWPDATPEVIRMARTYVPLMASPEEAVADIAANAGLGQPGAAAEEDPRAETNRILADMARQRSVRVYIPFTSDPDETYADGSFARSA